MHGFGHVSRIREFLDGSVEFFLKKRLNASFILYVSVDNIMDKNLIENYFLSQSKRDNVCLKINDTDIHKNLNESKFDYSFIDCLKIDKQILNMIKKISKSTISLSPILDYLHKVDTVFARSKVIFTRSKSTNTKIYSDSKYAIFRKIYPMPNNGQKERIVLFIGGNNRKEIIDFLFEYSKILNDVNSALSKKVIISNFNNNFKKTNNASVINLDDFIFFENDIVITSGGLSFMESAYSGCRTINFFLENNHQKIADKNILEFDNVISTGVFNKSKEFIIEMDNALKYFYNTKNFKLNKNLKNFDMVGSNAIWDSIFNDK